MNRDSISALLLIGLSAATLTGCIINPYSIQYRDVKTIYPPSVQNMIRAIPTKTPKTIQVDDINAAGAEWKRRGYILLGYVDWTIPRGTPYLTSMIPLDLRVQARKVGAEVVLFANNTPAGREEGIMVIPTYQPGESYTANTIGNATVRSPRGDYYYGNYGQTTTVTSPGTYHNEVVPYSTQLVKYSALFFALKKSEYLTPQQRAMSQ